MQKVTSSAEHWLQDGCVRIPCHRICVFCNLSTVWFVAGKNIFIAKLALRSPPANFGHVNPDACCTTYCHSFSQYWSFLKCSWEFAGTRQPIILLYLAFSIDQVYGLSVRMVNRDGVLKCADEEAVLREGGGGGFIDLNLLGYWYKKGK